MCTFQNKFLLCSCIGDDIKKGQIDWILKRRDQTSTIGQRFLPNDFSSSYTEESSKVKKAIIEKMNVLEQKQNLLNVEKLQDMVLFMLSELNSENCFDKELKLVDKDVLSIRLDSDLGLWVDFLYRKPFWTITTFSFNQDRYAEIIKGKIQSIS